MATPSRDKRTGIYYIRIRIPDSLKPYFEQNYGFQSEWKKPLVDHEGAGQARSEAAAKRLWSGYYEEWEAAKAAAEAAIAGQEYRLTARQTSQLCAQWLSGRLDAWGEDVPDVERLILIGDLYMEIVDVNRQRDAPSPRAVRAELRRHEPLVNQARQLLAASRIPLLETSDAFLEFCERLAETGLVLVQTLKARAEGDWRKPELLEVAPKADHPVSTSAAETMSQLYERYKAERQLNERQLLEHDRPINSFIKQVGDVAVDAATAANVRAYKDSEVGRGLSPDTINGGLSVLRRLFGYAVDNGLISDNPAGSIRAAKNKNKGRPRRPWGLAELQRLLDGPVHRDGLRPKGGEGEAAFWLPLLAVFTGARLEDIAQLRREDVRTSSTGVTYIDINGNHGKQLKNDSTPRLVPLHSCLLEWGFPEYVSLVAANGEDPVFPGVKTYRRQVAKAWGQWFGRYKRGVLHVDPKEVRKDFHSLRHGFKDAARASRIPADVRDQLQGHAPSNIGGGYGEGYSVDELAEYMKLLAYPGLDTAALDSRKR